MSAVLCAFKVPVQSKYMFADGIRKHVLDKWNPDFENNAAAVRHADFIQAHKKEYEYTLQFFEDVPYPKMKGFYAVRVLSLNYLVENYLWGIKHPQFSVDTRVQSIGTSKQQAVDYIARCIAKRHYFTIPAVSVDDYLNIIWEWQPKRVKEATDEQANK